MKRIDLVVYSVIALTLAACSGAPVWNASVFPQQPEYGMGGNTQTAQAEAAKK